MRTLILRNVVITAGWLNFDVQGNTCTMKLAGWGISTAGGTLTAGAAAAASAETPIEHGDLRVTVLGQDRAVVQRLDGAADDSILWVIPGEVTYYTRGDINRAGSLRRLIEQLTPIEVTHRVIPVSEAPAEVQAAHAAHLARQGAHVAAATAAGDPSYW